MTHVSGGQLRETRSLTQRELGRGQDNGLQLRSHWFPHRRSQQRGPSNLQSLVVPVPRARDSANCAAWLMHAPPLEHQLWNTCTEVIQVCICNSPLLLLLLF